MLLAGCAPIADTAPTACLLPAQRPMLVAELFFGRDIPGRQPLSEAEWSDFAASVIGRYFPDGFTVADAAGQWRNPQTDSVAREGTKLLIVAAEPRSDLASRLSAVIDAYRQRFRQQSVGLITSPACAAF